MLKRNSIHKSDICVYELWKCASGLCKDFSASSVIYYLLLDIITNHINVLYCKFLNV